MSQTEKETGTWKPEEIEKGAPEEQGVPSEAILRVIQRLDRQQIPMHSLLVMRHNKLLYEGYYAPCRKGELHRMFSVTKSFTALAVGKLAESGKICLDDPIAQYFPEYCTEQTHPWITETTIRNMLEMRTCHSATTYKVCPEKNWLESFFVVPPDHKPGTFFHYDTSSSHTLCALVEKLAQKPMLEYLREVLLKEIGFSQCSYIIKDPFGTSMGGSGLMATSDDLLRVGMLLMNHGKYNGKQLIDAAFLEEAVSCRVKNYVKGPSLSEQQGYGYQIWRAQYGSFMCYGMGGQLILCFPEKGLLCVTTADTQGIAGGTELILGAIYEELLPALADTALPGNAEAEKALRKATESLHIKGLFELCGTTAVQRREKCLLPWNGTYQMTDNAQGFGKMRLEWDGAGEGSLAFCLKGHDYSVAFGGAEPVIGSCPVNGMRCASSAVLLDENTVYIRIFLLDEACGSIRIQLYFGKNDLTVFMKKDDEMLFREFTGHLYGLKL